MTNPTVSNSMPRSLAISSIGVDLVLSLFRETFGTDAPLRGKMIFLNKVPGEDRTDEIVAHGAVLGIIRFDLRENRHILEIRQPGAELFSACASKNIVTFGSMSGHLKGKSIPGENIREIIGEFEEGESLILRKGEKIGAGIALGKSSRLKGMEKAVKIRDLDNPSGMILSPDSDRDMFVKANREHLKNIEGNAASDIKSFVSSARGERRSGHMQLRGQGIRRTVRDEHQGCLQAVS